MRDIKVSDHLHTFVVVVRNEKNHILLVHHLYRSKTKLKLSLKWLKYLLPPVHNCTYLLKVKGL